MALGEAPPAPVADLVGFRLVEVDEGEATMEIETSREHPNPMGTECFST
jgi:acyl-coenzyme A thioesterase PaaI-like protein